MGRDKGRTRSTEGPPRPRRQLTTTPRLLALAADPGFAGAWAAAWDHARSAGLWAKTYAGSHRHEYWAEGVQSYFGVNREGPAGGDGVHNHANTRAELRAHDPGLFALIDAVYTGRPLEN